MALLIILGSFLFPFPSAFLVAQYRHYHQPPFKNPIKMILPSRVRNEEEIGPVRFDRVEVLIVGRKPDIAELSLPVSIRLVIPEALLAKLVALDRQSLYTKGPDGLLRLRPRFTKAGIQLKIYSPIGDRFLPVQLRDLRHSLFGDSVTADISMTLPMTGVPGAYPFDWYWIPAVCTLELPENTHLQSSDSNVLRFPLALSFGLDEAAFGFQADTAVAEVGAQVGMFHYVLRRPTYYVQSIVITVVGLGILLAVLCLHLVLSRNRTSLTSRLMGLATAALTLLSFRTTLVPAALNGVTAVDAALTLYLMAIIFSVVAVSTSRERGR